MSVELAGAAISGFASLFGGRSAARDAARLRKQQQAQFDAAMDETIQRRTADARKAGIHPLAGIGASPGAGPTLTGAGVGAEGKAIADAGAAVGRAVSNKRMQEAQLENIGSSTALNQAQAAYWTSEAARAAPTSPGTSGGELDNNPFGGAEYVAPQIPKSKATGKTAGVSPATTDYVFPDGRTVTTYSNDMEADEIKQIDVLFQRAQHHGSDAWEWFIERMKRSGRKRLQREAAKQQAKSRRGKSGFRSPYNLMWRK